MGVNADSEDGGYHIMQLQEEQCEVVLEQSAKKPASPSDAGDAGLLNQREAS